MERAGFEGLTPGNPGKWAPLRMLPPPLPFTKYYQCRVCCLLMPALLNVACLSQSPCTLALGVVVGGTCIRSHPASPSSGTHPIPHILTYIVPLHAMSFMLCHCLMSRDYVCLCVCVVRAVAPCPRCMTPRTTPLSKAYEHSKNTGTDNHT